MRFSVPSPAIFRKFLPIYLIWRILSLFACLLHALLVSVPKGLRERKNVDGVLVQNPPAMPLLAVVYFYCILSKIFMGYRPAFIIDWHNLVSISEIMIAYMFYDIKMPSYYQSITHFISFPHETWFLQLARSHRDIQVRIHLDDVELLHLVEPSFGFGYISHRSPSYSKIFLLALFTLIQFLYNQHSATKKQRSFWINCEALRDHYGTISNISLVCHQWDEVVFRKGIWNSPTQHPCVTRLS